MTNRERIAQINPKVMKALCAFTKTRPEEWTEDPGVKCLAPLDDLPYAVLFHMGERLQVMFGAGAGYVDSFGIVPGAIPEPDLLILLSLDAEAATTMRLDDDQLVFAGHPWI